MNYENIACSVLTNKNTMKKILFASIDSIEPSEFDNFYDFACTLIEEFQFAVEDQVAKELKISMNGHPLNGSDHLYFDEIDAYIYNHDDYRFAFFEDFLRLLKNKSYSMARSRYLKCKDACEKNDSIYYQRIGALDAAIKTVNGNLKVVDPSLLDRFLGSPDKFIFNIELDEKLSKNINISPPKGIVKKI